MRILLTAAGVAVALVFIAVSAAMNVTFVASLGRTTFESQLFGAVSLACDAAKALLPIVCAHALRNGQRLRAAISIVMFALFTATSLMSAVGFTAVNRMSVAKSAEERTAQRLTIKKESAAIEARIANLPAHRPSAVVIEALAGAQLDRRWTLSKRCTDVTDARSRTHCEAYFALRAEHAAALEADKLEARRAALDGKMDATDNAPPEIDAQAGVVATAFDLQQGTIQRLLILLMALIVELGSGFGLYLAWVPAAPPQSRHDSAAAQGLAAPTDENPPHASTVQTFSASRPASSLAAPADQPLQLADASSLVPPLLSDPIEQAVSTLCSPRPSGQSAEGDPDLSGVHSSSSAPEILRAILRRPGARS